MLMAWQPQYIGRTENKKPRDVVKAVSDWNALWNTVITQSNNNADGVQELMQRMAANEQAVIDAVAGEFVPGIINNTDYFVDEIITTEKIAEEAITTDRIAPNAVTMDKLPVNFFDTELFANLKAMVYNGVQSELFNTGQSKDYLISLPEGKAYHAVYIMFTNTFTSFLILQDNTYVYRIGFDDNSGSHAVSELYNARVTNGTKLYHNSGSMHLFRLEFTEDRTKILARFTADANGQKVPAFSWILIAI